METHCPICRKPVTKVKDLPQEDCNSHSTCENEYYRHVGKSLIKIINPTTPTDIHFKKIDDENNN